MNRYEIMIYVSIFIQEKAR